MKKTRRRARPAVKHRRLSSAAGPVISAGRLLRNTFYYLKPEQYFKTFIRLLSAAA